MNGFEHRQEDGSYLVILPLTEFGNASYDEVYRELETWKQSEAASVEPMECRQAYRNPSGCGFSTGMVVFIGFLIHGKSIKPGECIRMVYDIIDNINFVKARTGAWKPNRVED